MTFIVVVLCLFFFSLGAVLATTYHRGIVEDAVKLSTEYQLALALAKGDLRVAEDRLKYYHTTASCQVNRAPMTGPGF